MKFRSGRRLFMVMVALILGLIGLQDRIAAAADYTLSNHDTRLVRLSGEDYFYLDCSSEDGTLAFEIDNSQYQNVDVSYQIQKPNGSTALSGTATAGGTTHTDNVTTNPSGSWRLRLTGGSSQWVEVCGHFWKPELSIYPQPLRFTLTEGGSNPSPKTLDIENAGPNGTELGSWYITKIGSMASRISIHPSYGSGETEVDVSVDCVGLGAGTYTLGALRVTSDGADSSPQDSNVICDVDARVPNVVGQPESSAESAITAAGLLVGNKTYNCSDSLDLGYVISQNLPGGTSVPPGTAVDLELSTGPCQVIVPNLVGQSESAAESAIIAAGLVVGEKTNSCSATIPSGHVISQIPTSGAAIPSGASVNLVISTGLCQSTVPNVIGQLELTAESEIVAAGLLVGTRTYTCTNTVDVGHVISQSPTGGMTVSLGSYVDISISTGACAQTILSLTPSPMSIEINDSFDLEVRVENVSNLYGFELDITFDPSKMEVLSVDEGGFLSRNGVDSVFQLPRTIDNTNGRVSNVGWVRLNPGIGISGDGILAVIHFKEISGASAPYTTNVAFVESETKLSDPSANSIQISELRSPAIIDFGSVDSDKDGLPNLLEDAGCTDPNNADTDNDGIMDGNEDTNKDGFVDPDESDPCLADTDGDGIYDGTEVGLTAPETPDTDLSAGFFIADSDPSTTTHPNNADSDGDLIPDGVEDINHNGQVDAWEPDPSQASSDVEPDLDDDGDVDGDDLAALASFFDPLTDQDKLATIAAMLGYTGFPVDADGDGVLDDGDFSGVVGDNPCTGGETLLCDDNCPNASNTDQSDTDNNGIGDVCDNTLGDCTNVNITGYWADPEWSNLQNAEDEDWNTAATVNSANKQLFVNHPYDGNGRRYWHVKYSSSGSQYTNFQCYDYDSEAWITIFYEPSGVSGKTVAQQIPGQCLQFAHDIQLRVHSASSAAYYEGEVLCEDSTELMSENFNDGDFTSNPAWTVTNNDDSPGTIEVMGHELHINRDVTSGNGGLVGIQLPVDIDITGDTTISFDARAVFRDVTGGCGYSCTEYPVSVNLALEDSTGNPLKVRYAVNYGGAVQDVTDGNFKQFALDIPQDQWVRDITHTISDAWPEAVKLNQVWVYGNGWDYESYLDNLLIVE